MPSPSSQETATAREQIEYLQSLNSIRDRCEMIYGAIKSGHPEARFDLDESKLPEIAHYVAEIIKRDYKDPAKDIPPHSRWRHFLPAGSVEASIVEPFRSAGASDSDVAKGVLDLFVVAVLLDAGAGDRWAYRREGCDPVGRSEGLAMAAMDMFKSGLFSSNSKDLRVDAEALMNLKREQLAKGMQADPETNPLVGLEGRLDLLKSLGKVLKAPKNEIFFFNPQDSSHRPGNLVYYLLKNAAEGNKVDVKTLWRVVVEGFGGVWPEEGRIKLQNVCLGDVWVSQLLKSQAATGENNFTDSLATFHKLSQWLTYSLLEPLEAFMGFEFVGKEQLTGLAEYRNGGLFVDLGAIRIKPEFQNESNEYAPKDEVIIQWRALTVCLLDRLAPILRSALNVSKEAFTLPKMLEGGTWKAGRIIAKAKRPDTAGPPIKIISDGTLF